LLLLGQSPVVPQGRAVASKEIFTPKIFVLRQKTKTAVDGKTFLLLRTEVILNQP